MSDKKLYKFSWIFLLSIVVSPVMAGTYKWVDEEGNVVYSQHPPEKGKYQSIKVKPSPRYNASANSAKSQSQTFLKEAEKKRNNDAKVNAELKKNADLKKKNCETAKKQLEFYTVYSRKKNEKGEYVRVSDKERETGQKEAKQAIKQFCD